MYPDTLEKRRAGMAALRARLQATHSRLANDQTLTAKQRDEQQKVAEYVGSVRERLGETLTFKIKGKPAVPVLSIADAASKWERYRHEMACIGKGCSSIGNGGIVREGKRIVARISYNGRIWQ